VARVYILSVTRLFRDVITRPGFRRVWCVMRRVRMWLAYSECFKICNQLITILSLAETVCGKCGFKLVSCLRCFYDLTVRYAAELLGVH